MCKIFIAGTSGPLVCVAKDLKIEDAIQFALNLHRSSNVEHNIFVREADKDDSILTLSLT